MSQPLYTSHADIGQFIAMGFTKNEASSLRASSCAHYLGSQARLNNKLWQVFDESDHGQEYSQNGMIYFLKDIVEGEIRTTSLFKETLNLVELWQGYAIHPSYESVLDIITKRNEVFNPTTNSDVESYLSHLLYDLQLANDVMPSFKFKGDLIENPFLSPCGSMKADPILCYGMSNYFRWLINVSDNLYDEDFIISHDIDFDRWFGAQ